MFGDNIVACQQLPTENIHLSSNGQSVLKNSLPSGRYRRRCRHELAGLLLCDNHTFCNHPSVLRPLGKKWDIKKTYWQMTNWISQLVQFQNFSNRQDRVIPNLLTDERCHHARMYANAKGQKSLALLWRCCGWLVGFASEKISIHTESFLRHLLRKIKTCYAGLEPHRRAPSRR